MKTISSFKGEYFFLSNFYSAPVEYEGIKYRNNEAAFQAQKCLSRRQDFVSLDPSAAKRLGRKVPLREDWEEVKDSIMYNICYNKFKQNSILKELLLRTKDATLIEGNWWNDTYWGVCRGAGKNKLGKILMEVRAALGQNT